MSYPPLQSLQGRRLSWLTLVVFALVLLGVSLCGAQSLDAGADVGRVYSIRDGYWVHAVTPAVTVTAGPLSLDLSAARHTTWLWQDATVGASWQRRRLTWSTSASVTRFPGVSVDLSWSVGVRMRLR